MVDYQTDYTLTVNGVVHYFDGADSADDFFMDQMADAKTSGATRNLELAIGDDVKRRWF